MQTSEVATESCGKRSWRRSTAVLVMAIIAAGTTACTESSAKPVASVPTTGTPSATETAQNTDQMHASATGTGPVNIHDGSPADGTTGQRSATISFSLDFAKCMRAHRVPKFPDPDAAKAGWLGPGSDVDPGSPEFEAAVNGPCRLLAPPAWLSSGQVGVGS